MPTPLDKLPTADGDPSASLVLFSMPRDPVIIPGRRAPQPIESFRPMVVRDLAPGREVHLEPDLVEHETWLGWPDSARAGWTAEARFGVHLRVSWTVRSSAE